MDSEIKMEDVGEGGPRTSGSRNEEACTLNVFLESLQISPDARSETPTTLLHRQTRRHSVRGFPQSSPYAAPQYDIPVILLFIREIPNWVRVIDMLQDVV